jgi:uncharacterized protein with HEPN domain
MSPPDPNASLADMLLHARKALQFCANKSKAEFFQDDLVQFASARAVELIGEAASRMPPDVQDQYPSIPWKDIIGTRHRLIHGYDRVDLDIIWETIQNDLPALIDNLRHILGEI